MELNYIYKFDFDRLYNSTRVKDGVLECPSTICDFAGEVIKKRDTLLFEQISLIKEDNMTLDQIIVDMDFSNFLKKKKSIKDLHSIKEISLIINKLNYANKTDKIITIYVKDFLKSNSMSRDSQIYYINSRCKGKNGNNLLEQLYPRVFFGFDKEPTILSKLYAYSGSLCSDCTLLKDIKFNEDEIVVVKDSFSKATEVVADCITMISKEFIYDKIRKIDSYNASSIDKLLNYTACAELTAIANSLDYNELKEELSIYLLREYKKLDTSSLSNFKNGIKKLLDNNRINVLGCDTTDEVVWERYFVKKFPFFLNLFDGEGLISKEFCDEIRMSLYNTLGNDTYKDSTSFQIRLPYIKGMVHACDFKAFFTEKGVKDIKHVCFAGNKEYDINKIKVILTESQFKASSFINDSQSTPIHSMPDYVSLINKYNYSFGVIDANKKEIEDGKNEYCSLEYQFISTLPLNDEELDKLYLKIIDRINESCSSSNMIKDIKGVVFNKKTDDLNLHELKAKQEYDMYKMDSNFYFGTLKYRRRKSSKFIGLKKDAVFSKFDVHGARRYLSSDLLEFLYYISGKNINSNYMMRDNDYYMPSSHPLDTAAVFLRSPHYSRNEIVLLYSGPKDFSNKETDIVRYQERKRYFDHLTGLVMINPRSLAAERLGGADYDGDTVVITNETIIVNCVKNNIAKFSDGKLRYSYPPCKIPSLKGEKLDYTNPKDRFVCLHNTFSSRVGQLSNEAVIKADIVYNNETKCKDKIAEYTILNGIEIDSAKSGKKPQISFDDDANKSSLLNEFLDEKKKYDDNKKTVDYYDFISDLETNGSFDESIKSNILKLAYRNDQIELTNKVEMKNRYDFTREDNYLISPKVLAISNIYSKASTVLSNIFRPIAQKENANIRSVLYNQIETLLSSKGIDMEYLLQRLTVDNLTAADLLSEYIHDDKYHFFTNKGDKINYIKHLFPNLDDNKVIDALTNFDNDGFRILFLVLNFLSKNINKIELGQAMINLDKLDNLDEEDIKKYYETYSKYETDINAMIDKNLTELELYNKIIDYLKNQAKDLSFNEIMNTIIIYDSSMMFDVFFDNISKKIEELKYGKRSI